MAEISRRAMAGLILATVTRIFRKHIRLTTSLDELELPLPKQWQLYEIVCWAVFDATGVQLVPNVFAGMKTVGGIVEVAYVAVKRKSSRSGSQRPIPARIGRRSAKKAAAKRGSKAPAKKKQIGAIASAVSPVSSSNSSFEWTETLANSGKVVRKPEASSISELESDDPMPWPAVVGAAPSAGPAPLPGTERHISIWIEDEERRYARALAIGQSYLLNFKVGELIAESLTAGPDSVVPAKDIPAAGLETDWLIIAHDAELAAGTPGTTATFAMIDGVQTWSAKFALLIPQIGESAVPQLRVKPLKADPLLDVIVTARGEIYRQFKIRLTASDVSARKRAEPSEITDELMPTPTAHIGLRTTHEWTTPPGALNITVFGSQASVQGNVGGMDVNSIEPWVGVPAQVSGPIKSVRDAAEALRAGWEQHFNDIPVDDLTERLNRWGKGGGGPEYNWRLFGDYADVSHRESWERMAASVELRRLALQGWRLFQAFFPRGSNLRTWIAALEPGARINISWTPLAGAGYIPHVPWGLMYVGDVPPNGQPVDPASFLGLRCRIAYASHAVQAASRALGALDATHRSYFLYWGDANNDVTGREARWQRGRWGAWPNQVFVPQTAQNAKAELLQLLDNPQPPTSVLYLFCQCNTAAGNDPVLRFGSTNDPANMVTQADFGTSTWTDRPLVFANACTTAAADPYMANDLERVFFDRGCRAYLGTETKVPIVFGSRFAEIFFHFFYRLLDPDPMAAGEAVVQTRIFLWTHYRNIGGLFYSHVNQYDLFQASDEEVLALRR